MKYFGNFKESIPDNLVKILLDHPYHSDGPKHNDNSEEVKLWKRVGYNLDHIHWGSYTSNMIDINIELPKVFGNITEIWYTKLLPGDMFPLHKDVFSYKDKHLIRFIILLQDEMPGHIFCYNNKILTNYKFGDAFVFDDPYMWHAAGNIGITPRLTMQVSSYIENFNFDTLKPL
jgi:hypothetical protein